MIRSARSVSTTTPVAGDDIYVAVEGTAVSGNVIMDIAGADSDVDEQWTIDNHDDGLNASKKTALIVDFKTSNEKIQTRGGKAILMPRWPWVRQQWSITMRIYGTVRPLSVHCS